MKSTLVASVLGLVLGLAPMARAQVAGNPYVDPKAPCYRWPATDMDGDGVFDRVDHCVNTPKGCVVDAYGCSTDQDGDGVCDGIDQCPDTPAGVAVRATGCPVDAREPERTSARPAPAATPPPAPAPAMKPMERQLVETGVIRLENIYFETGSAQLLSESEAALREAIETLEKYPALRIEVQGHTDTRGREPFNQRLSQTRAESVRAFMLHHSKLDAGHLFARGYGEAHPETDERNDEELLRNRRVVLKVLNPQALPRGVKVETEK